MDIIKKYVKPFFVQLLETALLWAAVLPLLYIAVPKIFGDSGKSLMLVNVGYIYYVLASLVLGVALYKMRPVFYLALNTFVAHSSYFGKVTKDSTNTSLGINPTDVVKHTTHSSILIVKYWVIAYLALLTLDAGFEEDMRNSQSKLQQTEIEALKIEIKKLSN